jgi:hypothetical protein
MRSVRVLVLVAVAALTGAAGTQASMPSRASFTARVTNPWFPLPPGTAWSYAGVKDGLRSRDHVVVVRTTATIDGVPCAVVEDRLYLAGKLRERTTDWYSQDARGNVWYLGEDTAELDARGHVTSREGTWQAGRDGAQAGIYMPARPRVGMHGRQEYYRGHAEDQFRVIAVFGTNSVLTQETTRLEPGVVDHKLYVRGVGTVLEQTERGGDERNELVAMTRG